MACSDPAPPVEVAEAFSAAQQQLREQAETRERNQQRPAFTTEELRKIIADPVHEAHLALWRNNRSYYALLELVEGVIEPQLGRMRRQDIEELLGKGNPDYPNSNGRLLEYVGTRHIPAGAHLLVAFDEKDIVQSVEWVSE